MVIQDPGRRFESRGKESPDMMYQGATIFVDGASARIKVKFQRGLTAVETLKSKMEFEHDCFNSGVRVKSYRTDNGTFTAQSVIEQIRDLEQTISFSGAGVQHQNAANVQSRLSVM